MNMENMKIEELIPIIFLIGFLTFSATWVSSYILRDKIMDEIRESKHKLQDDIHQLKMELWKMKYK